MGLDDLKRKALEWPPVALAKATFREFAKDKALRLGAALSYYSIFSIAPLLIIAVAVAGFFFGQEATQARAIATVRDMVGPRGADAVQLMMEHAAQPRAGIIATAASLVALAFGATGAFAQLQDALNTVWDVREKVGRGIRGFLRDRMLSFAMVLAVGFLLLVSLVVSAVLSTVGDLLAGTLPGAILVWRLVNHAISLAVVTVLFALIFRYVPEVVVEWRDVWVGAFATAVLFSVGQWAIGLYLGNSGISGVYGAAGSLLVLLVWVYYSAQILLLGAEFTQVYANTYGSKLRPEPDVVPLGEGPGGPPPEETKRRARAGRGERQG